MVDLPRYIPHLWLGPRRTQATQGDHRHTVGDTTTGFISMPLFNGESPADGDELIELLESYGLDISDFEGFGGGGVSDHGALTGLADDDHPQYLRQSEADALYSVLAHTHSYLTQAAADLLYSAIGHTHSYLTQAVADGLYDALGAATSAVSGHVAASDPHTSYLKEKASGGAASEIPLHAHTGNTEAGTLDHGAALTGLGDDDHPQYLNTTRGDARYLQLATPPFTRTSKSKTTASLAASAEDTGTISSMPIAFRMLRISTDRACRVRLYKSSATRTSDSSRAIGADVDIGTDHGLIFEFVATAAVSNYMLSPLVDVSLPTGTDIYYAIQNRDTTTQTVQFDFDYVRVE